jgi:hypothetical protein
VHHQFLTAVREEPLNLGCLVYLDVPEQDFVLQVPDFELLRGMGYEQVGGEGDFEYVEIDDQRVGLDHEELLGSFDAVKGDGALIAVADAGVAVIVGQVLYDELLADVDDLQHVLGR